MKGSKGATPAVYATGAAERLASLALLERRRTADGLARRASPRIVRRKQPATFAIGRSPKGLPRDTGVLALVDGETLIVQLVSPEVRAALKAQLQQSAPELTTAEMEVLREGGGGEGELRMGSVLWAIAQSASEAKYQTLLSTSLDVASAARRLGVTVGRVRQRLGARRLIGIKAHGDWRLPSFQFVGSDIAPGLDSVAQALRPQLGLLAIYNWFMTPNPDLRTAEEKQGLTPLAWLRAGHPPHVAAALAAQL